MTTHTVLNQTDLPGCGDPTCSVPAEWILPANATRRNADDAMHFCAEHLTQFLHNIGEWDGLLEQYKATKEALPAVPQYRELVSSRHTMQVIDLLEAFMAEGSSFKSARAATINLLGRLRDPRKMLDRQGRASRVSKPAPPAALYSAAPQCVSRRVVSVDHRFL